MSKLLLGGKQVTAFCQRGVHGTLMAGGQVLTTANLIPDNLSYRSPSGIIEVESVPGGLHIDTTKRAMNWSQPVGEVYLEAGTYVAWGPVPESHAGQLFWNARNVEIEGLGWILSNNGKPHNLRVMSSGLRTVSVYWNALDDVTVYPRLYRLVGA